MSRNEFRHYQSSNGRPRLFSAPVRSFSQREQAVAVFGPRCFYCGRDFAENEVFTLDHVLPACAGGSRRYNLVPSCAKCNQRKGKKMPTAELIAFVDDKISTWRRGVCSNAPIV